MLTIRINWHSPGYPSYHVYTCTDYAVSYLQNGNAQVLIDGGREVLLTPGNEMYVMNAEGKTIDVVRLKDPRSGETTTSNTNVPLRGLDTAGA